LLRKNVLWLHDLVDFSKTVLGQKGYIKFNIKHVRLEMTEKTIPLNKGFWKSNKTHPKHSYFAASQNNELDGFIQRIHSPYLLTL